MSANIVPTDQFRTAGYGDESPVATAMTSVNVVSSTLGPARNIVSPMPRGIEREQGEFDPSATI